MDVSSLTIRELRDGFARGAFSAREVTQAFFKRIKECDPELHAYVRLREDEARVEAEAVDARRGWRENAGLLAGIPLALKDNLLMEGERTTAGSKILETYEALYDATVVRKIKAAGAVVLGKTNMDEFAMGSSTENSAFFVTKNPHDQTCVPGGSSGGSAAAVAAGMAVAALGSDTGGSIREPAGFCGIVGMKPTYGAVSRYGLIAMASSLDQIGPLTKTVRDAAVLFHVIQGKDPHDATSVGLIADETPYTQEEMGAKVIGVPKEYFLEGSLPQEIDHSLEEVMGRLKRMGVRFKEVSLPHTKYALSCYYIIMPAEVSSNLARFDGIRYARLPEVAREARTLADVYDLDREYGFGDEPKRRIVLGTFVLSSGYYDAYYTKAQKVRRLIKEDFDRAFNPSDGGVDMIFAPIAPTPPFKIGERIDDPLAMYLSDIFTIPVNLAGLPGLSLPVKRYTPGTGELPIGFQLIGKPFHERDLFGVGEYYEEAIGGYV